MDRTDTPLPQPAVRDPAVERVLDSLHRDARGDWRPALRLLPYFVYSRLTGKDVRQLVTTSMLRNMYMPVSRRDGQLLYALARGVRARRVVEFGTSFGISTIYLAAAVAGNGGGRVTTTEIEPSKCRTATANIARAGLSEVVEVLQGNALETLKAVEGPVDFAFIDGAKNLYAPVLEALIPKLRSGAPVVADNVNRPATHPYLFRVRTGPDFVSALLPGGRMECSWYLP